MTRTEAIITSTVAAITAGDVLHVRAARLPGRRSPKTPALPAVDLTLGPDARGAFLVVDYSRKPGGEEDRYGSAEEAVRRVQEVLGPRLVEGLQQALVKLYGKPERPDYDRLLAESRSTEIGRYARVYAPRGHICGPIFGPSGGNTAMGRG